MDKRLAALDMNQALSALSSHSDLYRARNATTDPKRQAELAPLEHRAFAREFAQESPFSAAVSLPFAIPAYTAAKAVGLQSARSPASLEEMKQGFIGLNEGFGIEGVRQSILQKLQSFGGGSPAPGIPVDKDGKAMNTEYDMSNPAQRQEMVRDVNGVNTPPQWIDHRNRMGEQHPDYQPNERQNYNDYRQWVADSNRSLDITGRMMHYPKDQVEKIAWARKVEEARRNGDTSYSPEVLRALAYEKIVSAGKRK